MVLTLVSKFLLPLFFPVFLFKNRHFSLTILKYNYSYYWF